MKKLPLITTLLIGFTITLPVFGAQFNVVSERLSLSVKDQFRVDVLLDTENAEINALAGKLIFDKTLLKLKEIIDGNSIISLWVERPNQEIDGNEIAFSGVIPGGYLGYRGLLFSLIFEAVKTGRARLGLSDVRALLNDEQGTPARVLERNLELTVKLVAPEPRDAQRVEDTEPPEAFTPIITQNPEVFDNQYFLVFSTADKGSGIDYYEMQESRGDEPAEWLEAQSPHLLKDQELKSIITVKAVDRAGNHRLAVLRPKNPITVYIVLAILVILAAGIISRFRTRKIS